MALGIAGELGVQQKARRWNKYKDQHGREWGANVEKRTGHPVGSIQHKFKAPWYPANNYVEILPDEEGKPWEVHINYEAAVNFLVRRHEEWERDLIKFGVEMHGQAFDEHKPTIAVLDRLGPKPVPWQLYRAAQQGNGWILGFRDYDPDNPADVKLRSLLAAPLRPVGVRTEDEDFGDDMGRVTPALSMLDLSEV